MNRSQMREWLRIRLAIQTPLQRGIAGAQPGDVPTWQPVPDNYVLNNAIQSACALVNRYVQLTDSMNVRSLSIDAQTADGPYVIDLASIPGFPERAVNSIRRAWWNDGSQPVRLLPVILGSLDRVADNYLAYGPGVPYRFAIESYKFYLMPGPSAAGTLQFQAGAGIGGPIDDVDTFDQIPEDYDECVLYQALVEVSKFYPNDAEMSRRAQLFQPDAVAGMERLNAWFNGNVNEEVSPDLIYDARWMRRWRRRR